ncbi:DUF6167 family protein [Aeromicrobium sp. CF4.19]|uniref:DUF6167 family protein n=1 Tax=Aeromicrobium sp. CF4.19 TaxID=3373082 RepID=UPI003EE4B233
MNGRIVWFVAGSVAGAVASVKARRAAYRLSMPGLIDQAAALGEGVRAFSEEVRDGMDDRVREIEHEMRGDPAPRERPHVVPPPEQTSLDAQAAPTQRDHRS